MPVNICWFNENQTILVYEFTGNWTWNEFYPQYQQVMEMTRDIPHRIDVLLDMRRAGRLPLNILTHVRNISDRQTANAGLSVIVTNSQFIRAMYQAGCKFYGGIQHYFGVATSIEEAIAMFEEARQQAV
jgi:hypothetical protein